MIRIGGILSHVSTVLRRRARAELVSRRLRSHAAGRRHRSRGATSTSMRAPRSSRALTIVAAIETHMHADFVSGARELASLGAASSPGPARIWNSRITKRATARRSSRRHRAPAPAHAGTHARSTSRSSWRARPAGARVHGRYAVRRRRRPPGSRGRRRRRARSLRRCTTRCSAASAARRDVEVHPGHGAGSLCGAGIGKEPRRRSGTSGASTRCSNHDRATRSSPPSSTIFAETPPYFAG